MAIYVENQSVLDYLDESLNALRRDNCDTASHMVDTIQILEEEIASLTKAHTDLQFAYNEQMVELKEAKRLLKSAIGEWPIVCEWGNCGEYCGWYVNGQCSQKWSKEAEALKLIGEEGE